MSGLGTLRASGLMLCTLGIAVMVLAAMEDTSIALLTLLGGIMWLIGTSLVQTTSQEGAR